MSFSEIITLIVGVVLGGSGIGGIIFWLIKRYIEKRLNIAEATSKKRQAMMQEKRELDQEYDHAVGRCLFWLNDQVVHKDAGEDLENAMAKLNEVEERKKKREREIVAIYEDLKEG